MESPKVSAFGSACKLSKMEKFEFGVYSGSQMEQVSHIQLFRKVEMLAVALLTLLPGKN